MQMTLCDLEAEQPKVGDVSLWMSFTELNVTTHSCTSSTKVESSDESDPTEMGPFTTCQTTQRASRWQSFPQAWSIKDTRLGWLRGASVLLETA